jgi:molecular chaperone HscB
MQQIELRESLSGISKTQDPWVELDRLKAEIEQTYIELQREFQDFFCKNALDLAFNTVAKMQFFSKLLTEIDHIEDEMDDA